MATGQWKGGGQIFTCHDVKGYLKNIEPDPDYVPEDTGENLDSFCEDQCILVLLRQRRYRAF